MYQNDISSYKRFCPEMSINAIRSTTVVLFNNRTQEIT